MFEDDSSPSTAFVTKVAANIFAKAIILLLPKGKALVLDLSEEVAYTPKHRMAALWVHDGQVRIGLPPVGTKDGDLVDVNLVASVSGEDTPKPPLFDLN